MKMRTHLIKFFVVILGVRTPAPKMDDPVMKMPLQAWSWNQSCATFLFIPHHGFTIQRQLRLSQCRDRSPASPTNTGLSAQETRQC